MPSAPVATPGTSTPSTATEADGIYIVKRGESLADIASKVGLTEGQLLQLNGIRNRDFIFEGQQLAIKPGVQPPAQQVASTAGPGGENAAADQVGSAAGVSTTPTPTNPTGAVGAGAVSAAVAEEESKEDVAAATATASAEKKTKGRAENPQPVSAAQAEAVGPALGAAADDSQQNADPTEIGRAHV